MLKLGTESAMHHMVLAAALTLIHVGVMNQCYSPAKITASENGVSVGACNYTVGGLFYKSVATTAEFPEHQDFDIAANPDTVQERCYFVALDADGNATVTAGPVATGAGKADLPELPKTGTVCGLVRVALAPGDKPFTSGKDSLSGEGLTITCQSVGCILNTFAEPGNTRA